MVVFARVLGWEDGREGEMRPPPPPPGFCVREDRFNLTVSSLEFLLIGDRLGRS